MSNNIRIAREKRVAYFVIAHILKHLYPWARLIVCKL